MCVCDMYIRFKDFSPESQYDVSLILVIFVYTHRYLDIGHCFLLSVFNKFLIFAPMPSSTVNILPGSSSARTEETGSLSPAIM